ncbi:ribonuclease H-like domain-containing protein [Tanacetum coccineum]
MWPLSLTALIKPTSLTKQMILLMDQLNSPQLSQEDLEQLHPDDLEEMYLQWEMAMLIIRARRFIKRTGKKLDINGQSGMLQLSSSSDSEVDSCSKTCVKAYASLKEQYDNLSSDYKKSQFNLVSYKAGNFIPHKPDLTFVDEIVESENLDVTTVVTSSNAKTVENKGVSNTVESNAVKMNNTSAPIIEDWNSDDEINTVRPVNTANTKAVNTVRSVNTTVPKPIVNHPRTKTNAFKRGYSQRSRPFNRHFANKNSIINTNVNTARVKHTTARNRAVGNQQQKEYKEKGVIDSGCSRHMIGNKCYLDEYEDYNGGFVSFGDGKRRISSKGKIKTGSLDFDDVYFCKELKYNLFSVSQICGKKNNVLFTDTECLVLSSNFKLLDESQVLLRVPRKDNIYSVDLKSVVPTRGLTCLITKATIDESNTWHRRLGHINFKTMNKLVKGNLVKGLPSKIFENDHSCVAC